MTPRRRFPPPWRVVEMPGGYTVEDADGQQLGVFYGSRAGPDSVRQAQTLTMERGAADSCRFRKATRTTGARNMDALIA